MDYDRDKVDEMVLALLWLTLGKRPVFPTGVVFGLGVTLGHGF